MITNHYGITVDSNIPITGVLSIHDVAWDCIDYNDEICLTCEEIYNDIENDESIEDKDSEYEFIDCDSSHTKIIGDWVRDGQGLYEPDKDGEFAAIVNESTIQVVWSKFTTRGKLCSPCYSGQMNIQIDNPTGDYIGYTLPAELLYKPD